MKEVSYRELKIKNIFKILAFVLLYVVAVSLIFISYFGIKEISDFVNRMGPKYGALIVSLIFFLPLVLLLIFVTNRYSVQFNDGAMSVVCKKVCTNYIPYSQIGSVKVNARKLNTLDIYDVSGSLLFAITPLSPASAVTDIAQELSAKISFKITKEKRKIFSSEYEVITYTRQ